MDVLKRLGSDRWQWEAAQQESSRCHQRIYEGSLRQDMTSDTTAPNIRISTGVETSRITAFHRFLLAGAVITIVGGHNSLASRCRQVRSTTTVLFDRSQLIKISGTHQQPETNDVKIVPKGGLGLRRSYEIRRHSRQRRGSKCDV